jgi:hypothetical protein
MMVNLDKCKWFYSNSIDPLPNFNYQKYDQIDQYKCCKRKIKTEIIPLNTDITGQMAQPFQISAKKINKNTQY